jgi:hypothetical protein
VHFLGGRFLTSFEKVYLGSFAFVPITFPTLYIKCRKSEQFHVWEKKYSIYVPDYGSEKPISAGVARFSLVQHSKMGKYIPNDHKIYQIPQIHEMALKYTKIFYSKTFKKIPKLGLKVCKYICILSGNPDISPLKSNIELSMVYFSF